jgi:hypothetical protein
MSSKFLKFLIPCFLIFFTVFTRFYKLDWGNGYFFHPDENNMTSSVLQMNSDNFNPHFFAYGQFPLFLTYFTTPKHDFSTIALTLRFWSAVFSSFSVLFFYLVGLQVFKSKKNAFIFTLLIIFTPGLIQSSHFGTTESILVFVFIANIFLSIKIFDKFNYKYLFLAALISGIGLATKITSVFFLVPIFLSFLFRFLQNRQFSKFLFHSFLFFIFVILIGIIFSPFNLLDFSSFLSSIKYEIQVANGQIPVFYTNQFISTLPYFFQFQKIFPYTNGIPVLVFSLFGLFFIPKKSKKFLLVTISVLIFFLFQGQLYVKWTRFMAPIFFVFPFLSVYFFQKIKPVFLQKTLILIAIMPGIFFLRTYVNLDIRVQASNWINQNIPKNSQILSEFGNVINLPVFNTKLNIVNFDFYNLDHHSDQKKELDNLITRSNYIFIPSRRVFKNQNNNNFPDSQIYYQQLFSGQLNFSEIKKFANSNSLFLNSENAEETWSVFDNPTIRIFAKNNL